MTEGPTSLAPVSLDAIEAEAAALMASFVTDAPDDDVERCAAVATLRACADHAARKYRRAIRLALSLYVHDKARGVPSAVGLSQADFRKEVMEAMWMTSHGTGIGTTLEQAVARVKYYPEAANELPIVAPRALLARAVSLRCDPIVTALWRELVDGGVKRVVIADAIGRAEEPDPSLLSRLGYERPPPYGCG